MTTKGCHTYRGYDKNNNGNNNDDATLLASAVALSESDPEMMFRFGRKEATTVAAGYTKLVFYIFALGSLLVLLAFVLVYWLLYQQGCGGPGGGAVVSSICV